MATRSQINGFIAQLSALAIAEAKKRSKWVLPSVCIAQAALETGWGTSSLMKKANAYFGIKATGWRGKVYNSATLECYDGKTYTNINACFRAYDSVEDSVKDYYDLITGAARYQKAVNETDAKTAITAIKNGGYATDPTYVTKVMKIIENYNLTKYDSSVIGIKIEDACNKVSTYTVKAGDSLWKIAAEQLGKGSRYTEIKKLNEMKSNLIYAGQILKMPEDTLKSVDEIAKEVIAGKWGFGNDRKKKLSAAGYNYKTVQKKVNEMLS